MPSPRGTDTSSWIPTRRPSALKTTTRRRTVKEDTFSTSTLTLASSPSNSRLRSSSLEAVSLQTRWEWEKRSSVPTFVPARPRRHKIYCSKLIALWPIQMMASLIHTNRDSTDLPIFPDDLTDSTQAAQSAADEPSSSKRVRRQLTLDSSFRPKKVDLSDEDEDEEENSDDERPRRRKTNKKKGPTATLVVCPVSLLHQWKDELDRSAKKGSLRVVSALRLLLFPCPRTD
jgi:hypothetical protein